MGPGDGGESEGLSWRIAHERGLPYRQGRFIVDAERSEISEHGVHDFQGKLLDALGAAI